MCRITPADKPVHVGLHSAGVCVRFRVRARVGEFGDDESERDIMGEAACIRGCNWANRAPFPAPCQAREVNVIELRMALRRRQIRIYRQQCPKEGLVDACDILVVGCYNVGGVGRR